MSDITTPISDAKTWCTDARRILKNLPKGRATHNTKSRNIQSRAKTIATQLTTLAKTLRASQPEIYAQYVERFQAIATGLRTAASEAQSGTRTNTDLVDQEALALKILKKELKIAILETNPNPSRRQQNKIDKAKAALATQTTESRDSLDAAAKHNYDVSMEAIEPRLLAALAWTNISPDLLTRQRALLTVKRSIDNLYFQQRYREAVKVLADLRSTLKTAEAAKRRDDISRVEFQTLTAPIQTVLGWPTASLDPALQAAQTAIRTGYATIAAFLAHHDYEAAVTNLKSGTVVQAADDAIALKAHADAYSVNRQKADNALTALQRHGRHSHVTQELNQATAHLVNATSHANASRFEQANAKVDEATKACQRGTAAANQYDTFKIQLAQARIAVTSIKGLYTTDSKWKRLDKKLKDADILANTTRDYAKATKKTAEAQADIKAGLYGDFVEPLKLGVKELRKRSSNNPDTAAFVKPDIDILEATIKDLEANLATARWSRVVWEGQARSAGILDSAYKFIARRRRYDAERIATFDDITMLGNDIELQPAVQQLHAKLAIADKNATRLEMRLEKGRRALKSIRAECRDLEATKTAIRAYKTARQRADTDLAHARKDPARGQVRKTLQLATDRLTLATQTVASAGVDTNTWNDAVKLAEAAVRDLDEAKGIMAQLVDATAAVRDAQTVKSRNTKKHAASLRKRLQAIQSGPLATTLTTSLRRAETLVASAENADTTSAPLAERQTRLTDAAKALLDLDTSVQALGIFDRDNRALQQRLTAVAVPLKMKAKTDAVAALQVQANTANVALRHADALDLMRQAEVEMAKTEALASRRQTFDTREAALRPRLTALPTGPTKTRIQKLLTEGARFADAFDFDRATQSLRTGEAELETEAIQSLIATNPSDPAILTRAKTLADQGDGKLVDAMIQRLTTGDVTLIQDLAGARFGVTMDVAIDTTSPTGQAEAFEDAKQICKMLAMVPEDSANNPSLRKVQRLEPTSKGGGYYQSSVDLAVVKGRPKTIDQSFGPRIQRQLPKHVEEDCKPVDNTPVDYFDFAILHEIGHAIDDRLGFMSAREGKTAFGGWRVYGGNVAPIAKVVAAKFDYDEDYTEDLILGKKPSPAAVPAGKDATAWSNSRTKVDDWHKDASKHGIWWNNSQSAKVAINGRVYQQAYPRNWVSYELAARNKALTGYQFRAPGEWFAELYAGFHSGKLKASHPSANWLKSLSA